MIEDKSMNGGPSTNTGTNSHNPDRRASRGGSGSDAKNDVML